jgi:hypothetical protein
MSTSLLLSLHSQDASKHPKYDLMAAIHKQLTYVRPTKTKINPLEFEM